MRSVNRNLGGFDIRALGITSRPLIDGNKGTGWTLLITFLMLNGVELVADTEDAFTFVLSVATAGDELAVIAMWIETHLVPA